MNINFFFDPRILVVSLFLNVLISIIKPFIKLKHKLYRILILNAVLLVLSIISAYVFHRTEIEAKNSLFVDICLIGGMSFVIYKIGYKDVVDKIKEKL